MADTQQALERLRDDVEPMRLRSAADVRRRADRQRRRRGVAVAVGTAVAAAAIVAGSAVVLGADETNTTVATDSGTPTFPPTASGSGLEVVPLLPEPWTLTDSGPTTLPGEGPAGADLCGVGATGSAVMPGPMPAELQRFDNGGTTVQIWTFTEDPSTSNATAANLFKAFYSECGGPGVVESLGGPTNYWQVPGSPARMASLWKHEKVYVIRVTRQASDPPDIAELVATIDDRKDL